jgi:hypothetical protein
MRSRHPAWAGLSGMNAILEGSPALKLDEPDCARARRPGDDRAAAPPRRRPVVFGPYPRQIAYIVPEFDVLSKFAR